MTQATKYVTLNGRGPYPVQRNAFGEELVFAQGTGEKFNSTNLEVARYLGVDVQAYPLEGGTESLGALRYAHAKRVAFALSLDQLQDLASDIQERLQTVHTTQEEPVENEPTPAPVPDFLKRAEQLGEQLAELFLDEIEKVIVTAKTPASAAEQDDTTHEETRQALPERTGTIIRISRFGAFEHQGDGEAGGRSLWRRTGSQQRMSTDFVAQLAKENGGFEILYTPEA